MKVKVRMIVRGHRPLGKKELVKVGDIATDLPLFFQKVHQLSFPIMVGRKAGDFYSPIFRRIKSKK